MTILFENFDKKDLIYISNYIFGSYVEDPSNENDSFKRVKIRNFFTIFGLFYYFFLTRLP